MHHDVNELKAKMARIEDIIVRWDVPMYEHQKSGRFYEASRISRRQVRLLDWYEWAMKMVELLSK